MKHKVDGLEVDKLVLAPADLSKLSDAVKMMLLKKIYNAKIKDVEDKIPSITNLATNTNLNAETNEAKNEIPSLTVSATTSALGAKINKVKNKISNITNVATNTTLTGVDNKIPYQSKYIITPEFIKLTAENFTARLKQVNLATKGDIVDFVNKADFDDKLKI